MSWRLLDNGLVERADLDPWGPKLGVVDGLAYVRSGAYQDGDRVPSPRTGLTFVERARALYAGLSGAKVAVPAGFQGRRPDGAKPSRSDLDRFGDSDMCVIPTSWPSAPGPAGMALLTADGEQWWGADVGGVAIAGTCRDYGRDLVDVKPKTLIDCQALALRIALGFISWIEAQNAEHAKDLPPGIGLLAPAARPLHGIIVNRTGWERWTVL